MIDWSSYVVSIVMVVNCFNVHYYERYGSFSRGSWGTGLPLSVIYRDRACPACQRTDALSTSLPVAAGRLTFGKSQKMAVSLSRLLPARVMMRSWIFQQMGNASFSRASVRMLTSCSWIWMYPASRHQNY